MSSVPRTSVTTLPTREVTSTRSPSVSPRSARSSGFISRWCRGLPRVSRSLLCIQELLSRWWRRPISTSRPSSADAASSCVVRRNRSRSAITRSGARWIRLSLVCSRAGIVGRSGPRSTPAGLARSARIDVRRPVEQQRGDQRRRAQAEPGTLGERLAQRLLLLQPGGGAQRDLAEDLPVVHGALGLGEHRRGEPRGVAHGEGRGRRGRTGRAPAPSSAAGSRRRAGWSR